MDGEKGWKLPGEVVRKCAPRSFLVQTPRGHLRRNRRHLKQIHPSACSPDDLRHQKSEAVFSPDHTVRQEPYPTASSDQQPGVYLAGQPGTPVSDRPLSPPPSPGNTSFSSTQPTHKSSPVPAQSSVSTATPVRTRCGHIINKPARHGDFVCSVVPWKRKETKSVGNKDDCQRSKTKFKHTKNAYLTWHNTTCNFF